MARARKKSGKGGNTGETEIVQTNLIFPESKLVQDLVRAKRNAKKNSSSINDVASKKISAAAETKHLDRPAFNIAYQLSEMDDERLAITFPHLMRYLEDLEIAKRAQGAQEEMFEAKETGPGLNGKGKEKDKGEGADNVTHIGTAARKVAEAAGEKA